MLKVRIEKLDHIAILHVVGHIVIGPEIELLRTAVLSQAGVKSVLLDLSRTSTIDARGLGVLLELRERLHANGIQFRLAQVSGLVEQLLKMTCLDAVFEIGLEQEIRSQDFPELVLEDALS